MSPRPRTTETALRRTLSTLALAIGSILPFIIAWVLIASTNDENPLDAIPDYVRPLQETLVLSEYQITAARTTYEYRNTVRVIIEGTLALENDALSDGFFTFTDADGTPLESPVLNDWTITVNDQALRSALNLEDVSYERDHVYTGLYEIGTDWQKIAFGTAPDQPVSGDLSITVIQVE